MTNPAEGNRLRDAIEHSRAERDPFLRGVFACFAQDFFNRFRTEQLSLIPKKLEFPDVLRPTPGPPDTAYIYLLNAIHPNGVVYPITNPFGHDLAFEKSGRVTHVDWTPNVSLQFAVYLLKCYSQSQQRYTGSLRPDIYVSAWGRAQFDQNSLAIPGFYAYVHDGGWNLLSTQIFIDAENKPDEDIFQQIQLANSLLEKNVRNHEQIVSGHQK